MTERKKITLGRPSEPNSDAAPEYRRKPPVRGTAPRKRMTAAEAAQAREEAAARAEREARESPYRERQDDRFGNRRSDQYADRRGERGEPFGARQRPAWEDRAGRQSPDDQRGPRHAQPRHDPREGYREFSREDRQDRGERGDRQERRERPYDAHQRPAQPLPERQAPEDGRVRLSKLMSERGMASRREADEWIEQGWVSVDGEVVAELGSRVWPHVTITIDPLARTQQAERVTILLHKPMGYVSGQAEDGYEPAVALIRPENRWVDDKGGQLTRGHLRNLAPAGRLDIDSTGLLVLTQDGRIAKQLIGEDSGIEKEYLVRVQWMDRPDANDVSAIVPPEALAHLRFGLELDGKPLKPAQVSWQNEHQLRFVLREGKKRQIRRMCELVGLKVVGLKRVRMGQITLGKLPVGQWRFLRPHERF